ncbi:MAG: Xylose isomerase domain protein TIM barrel [Parcubacteria group bacterium GW2011_GWA2_43_17]|nr:MAG: Xylose isomerase domain protein TIM barrel [Parcubacteria group bacterium GW2011_GWA2_43_17]OHB42128.1 MAG: hypothetical protein A2Y13_07435 [Planctomycetes bacterium GWC2_45_44]
MNKSIWSVGFCSWCVGDDLDALNVLKKELDIKSLHLSLIPVLDKDFQNFPSLIKDQGFEITATMVGFPQEDYRTLENIKATGGIAPDDWWEINKKRVLTGIKITSELDVKYLSFHFGYIEPGPSEYADKLYDRVRLLADSAADHNVMLLMETGQETSEQLCQFIEQLNHPAVGVNFDPGNMILYGKGDPVAGLIKLAPWIKHVHIKDALPPRFIGDWGTEMPWGQGRVGSDRFLKTLAKLGFTGALAIEREVGGSKLQDAKAAVESIRTFAL